MPAAPPLVLGTHNAKKLRELAQLLPNRKLELRSLADLPLALEIEESGKTFAENARLKATQQAIHLGQWVLAEDSGLMVDALQGAPGVRSARYSGPNASDETNNALLLTELSGVPAQLRTASYCCHLILANPQGTVRAECEARCCGRIRERPAGNSGFGYDPLFEVVEYHKTFAELGEAVKGMISHRGRALRRMIPQLLILLRPD